MTTMVTEDDFSRCLLLNTIKAARALTRRYDKKLKPFGVTVAQFAVMKMVRHHEGESINVLAERIAMDRTTLSRNIDLLARMGLVEKLEIGSGNAKTCRLTEKGSALLTRLIPIWLQSRDELQALLVGRDPEEYLSVLQLLARG